MLSILNSDKLSMPSAFDWSVRVYYEDTDAGGIVYYANYLKFFERARTEWLRHLGIAQQELAAQHDTLFVVKSVSADYHAPARLDDVIKLTLSVEKLGRASLQLVQHAWCGERLLNTAHVKVGCVDASLRPRSMPAAVAQRLTAGTPA